MKGKNNVVIFPVLFPGTRHLSWAPACYAPRKRPDRACVSSKSLITHPVCVRLRDCLRDAVVRWRCVSDAVITALLALMTQGVYRALPCSAVRLRRVHDATQCRADASPHARDDPLAPQILMQPNQVIPGAPLPALPVRDGPVISVLMWNPHIRGIYAVSDVFSMKKI